MNFPGYNGFLGVQICYKKQDFFGILHLLLTLFKQQWDTDKFIFLKKCKLFLGINQGCRCIS